MSKRYICQCDCCGKEILTDESYKAIVHKVMVQTGDYVVSDVETEMEKRDFCYDCMVKISDAIERVVKTCGLPFTIPANVNKDNFERIEKPAEVKKEEKHAAKKDPENNTRKNGVDHGKIIALWKNGWTPVQIARDMHISDQTVYNHIKAEKQKYEEEHEEEEE